MLARLLFWLRHRCPKWWNVSSWLPPRAAISLGERGERAAARYLRRLGYRIVARRLRDRHGELDLIALDRHVIVFVEVKTRSTALYGSPAAAVDATKRQRIIRSARYFLKRHRLTSHPARFDIIAVTWPPSARKPQIEHFISAFEASCDDF